VKILHNAVRHALFENKLIGKYDSREEEKENRKKEQSKIASFKLACVTFISYVSYDTKFLLSCKLATSPSIMLSNRKSM